MKALIDAREPVAPALPVAAPESEVVVKRPAGAKVAVGAAAPEQTTKPRRAAKTPKASTRRRATPTTPVPRKRAAKPAATARPH